MLLLQQIRDCRVEQRGIHGSCGASRQFKVAFAAAQGGSAAIQAVSADIRRLISQQLSADTKALDAAKQSAAEEPAAITELPEGAEPAARGPEGAASAEAVSATGTKATALLTELAGLAGLASLACGCSLDVPEQSVPLLEGRWTAIRRREDWRLGRHLWPTTSLTEGRVDANRQQAHRKQQSQTESRRSHDDASSRFPSRHMRTNGPVGVLKDLNECLRVPPVHQPFIIRSLIGRVKSEWHLLPQGVGCGWANEVRLLSPCSDLRIDACLQPIEAISASIQAKALGIARLGPHEPAAQSEALGSPAADAAANPAHAAANSAESAADAADGSEPASDSTAANPAKPAALLPELSRLACLSADGALDVAEQPVSLLKRWRAAIRRREYRWLHGHLRSASGLCLCLTHAQPAQGHDRTQDEPKRTTSTRHVGFLWS